MSAKNLYGKIHLPEVSGASMLGNGAIMLVSDEFGIVLIGGAEKCLLEGTLTPGKDSKRDPALKDLPLDDAEDVAWDGKRYAYVITSHSRNRRGNAKRERCRMARLDLKKPDALSVQVSEGLWWGMLSDLPILAHAAVRTPAQGGLNIEACAWDPEAKNLLVGFRSPTRTCFTKRTDKMQEDTLVVRVENLDEMFEEKDCPACFATDGKGHNLMALPLDSHGLRGMTYDEEREGFWLLSGLSMDPNHEVRNVWRVWFLDKKGYVRRADFEKDVKLETPEAICLVHLAGEQYLLLVEDDKLDDDEEADPKKLAKRNSGCRYALVPTKRIKIRSSKQESQWVAG